MRQALKLHPDSRCTAVTAIEAEASRHPGVLEIRYRIIGDMAGVVLPLPAVPVRTDGLWRHTCLEAFVQPADDDAYYEFNFAPSGEWAGYRFDGYRQGMAPTGEAPRIEVTSSPQGFELFASVALTDPHDWRLGLSAVIEETDGGTSYWAVAHPLGKADFHHADCFRLQVPALGGA